MLRASGHIHHSGCGTRQGCELIQRLGLSVSMQAADPTIFDACFFRLVQYSIVLDCVVWCGVVWCGVTWHGMAWHGIS